jgi:hypothetical protein
MGTITLSNGQVLDAPDGAEPQDFLDFAISEGDVEAGATLREEIGMLEGVAQSFAQGATLDFGDEMSAGVASGIGKVANGDDFDAHDAYNSIRDNLRSKDKRFAEESPWASGIARVAGAMTPVGLALRGGKLLGNMAMGAGAGVADYFGKTDELEDATLAGAGGAATLGAVLPAVFKGVGGGYKMAKQLLSGRKDQNIKRTLDAIVQKTGLSAKDVELRIRSAKSQDSIIDLFPDSAPAAAKSLRESGDSSVVNTIRQNLDKPGGRGRVRGAIPKSAPYHQTMDDMVNARVAESEKLYGNINKSVVSPTDDLVGSIMGSKQISAAYRGITREPGEVIPKLSELKDGAQISGKVLQKLKWGVDDRIRALKKSTSPSDTLELSKLMEQKTALMKAIDDTSPGFAAANKHFAGAKSMEEAMEKGKDEGLNARNIEDQLNDIANFGKSEKDAYSKGVVSNMLSGMGKADEESLSGLNRLTSDNSRQVMKELFGEADTNKMLDAIKSEKGYRGMQQDIMGGSSSQMTKMAQSDMLPGTMQIPKGGAKGIVVDGIINKVNKTLNRGMPESERQELASLLTDPARVGDAYRMLIKVIPPEKAGVVMELLKAAGTSAAITPNYGVSE